MAGSQVTSVLALAVLFAVQALCAGAEDPAFTDIPFERWAASGNHTGIRWEAETPPPALSSHQRLQLTVHVYLDIRELAKRGGRSDLVTLAQLRKGQGILWRTHGTFKGGAWEQSAFVLPGDYELELAAYDPDRGAYSFTRRKIHAAPLKADPLGSAWQNLPEVEWIPSGEDSPDAWYLPTIQGRLHLPVPVRRPVHLDVLLNATPGGKASGSVAEMRRNMEALIPALKVISQLDLPNESSMDISLLDLVHQHVAFEQSKAQTLDWTRLRTFFAGYNPGLVDVATLESSWKMGSFFDSELARLRNAPAHNAPGDGHGVIVLSGPAFFDGPKAGEANLDKSSDSRVFYIRYRPLSPELLNPRHRVRPGSRMPPPMPRPIFYFALALDDLEKPLEPLNSRIFDAISPEQFRRVLAAVIDQIGKL